MTSWDTSSGSRADARIVPTIMYLISMEKILDDREIGNAYRLAWTRAKGPEYMRAKNLWQLYRIRLEEYDAWREKQDYRCAICGTHEDDIEVRKSGRPRKDGTERTPAVKLVVDHCHQSEKVRGLLCSACNYGVGFFRDEPRLLHNAAVYLLGALADEAEES